MDHLLEAYASSSDDAESDGKTTATVSTLGELPMDVLGMFQDSEYDLATERRRAEERTGDKPWVRRFPHERGNWPTYVFVPVPNSTPFVSMVEASVAHFRRRLSAAWEERQGSDGARRGTKRARTGGPSPKRGGKRAGGKQGPPEVVMNDMGSAGQQHLSLSKTVALRAHEIEPFAEALKGAVKSSRSFTASIVGGYDVLVNDEKTRSFVCLRVRAGRQLLLQLIGRVDPLMRRFNQSEYYQDPVVHVSVASVLGDVSSYVRSSWSNGSVLGEGGGTGRRDPKNEKQCDVGGSGSVVSDEEDAPSEVCLPVGVVVCKAGTRLFEAPLLPQR